LLEPSVISQATLMQFRQFKTKIVREVKIACVMC